MHKKSRLHTFISLLVMPQKSIAWGFFLSVQGTSTIDAALIRLPLNYVSLGREGGGGEPFRRVVFYDDVMRAGVPFLGR